VSSAYKKHFFSEAMFSSMSLHLRCLVPVFLIGSFALCECPDQPFFITFLLFEAVTVIQIRWGIYLSVRGNENICELQQLGSEV
jgi:hypothetical protein